jgi:hypothetical protein
LLLGLLTAFSFGFLAPLFSALDLLTPFGFLPFGFLGLLSDFSSGLLKELSDFLLA